MDLLGHSSITVTLDTYSHVMRPMQDDAAAKMDAVLADPSQYETGERRFN